MAGEVKRVAQRLHVRDSDGRPCAGITVAVTKAQGPVPELGYVTGDDGEVQIGLPPGPASFEVLLPDGRRHSFAIKVSAESGRCHEVKLDGTGS
jgi:hypothetical protein